jgi:hypothetical protein
LIGLPSADHWVGLALVIVLGNKQIVFQGLPSLRVFVLKLLEVIDDQICYLARSDRFIVRGIGAAVRCGDGSGLSD